MGYKIMFSSAPKQVVYIIEMPRYWTIFISMNIWYVIKQFTF